jgi:type I restriction enzyme S subunit
MTLRKGWEVKSFSNCIKPIKYTIKIAKKDFLEKGNYPIVSQESGLINGYWNDEEHLLKTTKPIIVFGDHTKIVKYIDFKFVLGADGVKILLPNDGFNSRYFYYFLSSVKLKNLGYARHYRLLNDLNVPIPPLPEQQRIVEILDEAFAGIDTAIANTQQAISNAKELFDTELNRIFSQRGEGWEVKKFNDVLNIRNGRNQRDVKSETGAYPILGSAGNVMGYANSYICEAGTTIIGRKGNISNPIYVNTPFWNVDTAFGLSPKTGLHHKFLYFYCLNYDFAALNRGTTIPSLVKTELLEITIPIPPLPEQQRIVAKLDSLKDQTQALTDAYQRKLAALQELKQSLLHKAFTGELTANWQASA